MVQGKQAKLSADFSLVGNAEVDASVVVIESVISNFHSQNALQGYFQSRVNGVLQDGLLKRLVVLGFNNGQLSFADSTAQSHPMEGRLKAKEGSLSEKGYDMSFPHIVIDVITKSGSWGCG